MPRCNKPAEGWLYAPDGKRVPGCRMCATHARAVIDEYQAKLGETWTLRPPGPTDILGTCTSYGGES